MKKIIFILIAASIIPATSCSRWFVNSLGKSRVMEIKNGDGPGQVQIVRDEYSLNELSFRLEMHDGKAILADNNLKRLQVLDSSGTPELILGSLNNIDRSRFRAVNFNFSVIGAFTLDDSDNLYIQNRLESRKGGENGSFSPSYILVFNKNGELQYTMGKSGTPDLPFFYIEKLFTDSSNRLHVISRTFNSWELFIFNKRKREKYIDFSKIDFSENEGGYTYSGKIENMILTRSGDNMLISVAYYHDVRFKYRKVYEFSLEDDKIVRELTTIPDPKNVLFSIVDDKIIYLWNIEGKRIKFMLINTDGNIINNIRLDLDNNTIFSKIITDEKGKIFSYHVAETTMKIYEWN
ncbi:MAG: hypothetical protein GXY14_14995 [Spirochaetes bacterium]|nr:hypothetical protein [Spirochaetota bacterium]